MSTHPLHPLANDVDGPTPARIRTIEPVAPAVDAAPPSFGRAVALFVPAAIVLVFAFGLLGIAGRTDTIEAAIGYAAYLTFWLGGGGGFLAAGIYWGLGQERANHLARHRP